MDALVFKLRSIQPRDQREISNNEEYRWEIEILFEVKVHKCKGYQVRDTPNKESIPYQLDDNISFAIAIETDNSHHC